MVPYAGLMTPVLPETLTCPICAKAGHLQENGWEVMGRAPGFFMSGLDPRNCVGCWDLLTLNHLTPAVSDVAGVLKPVPRPDGPTYESDSPPPSHGGLPLGGSHTP
jgi:hypothetical protein